MKAAASSGETKGRDWPDQRQHPAAADPQTPWSVLPDARPAGSGPATAPREAHAAGLAATHAWRTFTLSLLFNSTFLSSLETMYSCRFFPSVVRVNKFIFGNEGSNA